MSRPDDRHTHAPPPAGAVGQVLQVGGGYRQLEKLGQGAFGEVWRAAAPGGVEVAVKVISRSVKPEEARRELEALEIIKRLRHQNLLSLQAFFSLEAELIIVLELADGSLRGRLRACPDGQGLPVAELLRYTAEAAEALDYLHEQKVQHRDIKPDNLLLLGNHLKVADCGLARVLESVALQTASHAGTPAYMAPEIWNGQLSPHSDQYSLAVSYGELRLGRFPIPHNSLANLMYAHLHLEPELDPLPAAEQAVIRRALAKDPGDRFPSCVALAKALTQVRRAAGTASRPVPSPSAVPPSVGQRAPPGAATQPPSSHRTVAPPRPPAGPKAAPRPRLAPTEIEAAPPARQQRWKRPAVVGGLVGLCLLLALVLGIGIQVGSRPGAATSSAAQGTGTGKEEGAPPKAGPPEKGAAAREVKQEPGPMVMPVPPGKQEPKEIPAPQVKQEPFAKTLGIDMLPIAAGSFLMGSDKSQDKGAYDDEQPPHRVTIDRPFFMAAHKTTQAQFEKVLGRKPSYFSATGEGKDKVEGRDTARFPVERVSWFDAVEFCNKLSEQEGRRPCYRLGGVERDTYGSIKAAEVEVLGDGTGYRLPTEAEWEYCARAGTTSKYSFGNDEGQLGEHGWFTSNSGGRTHPVGEKTANPWGLYDMGGLAWEWCEDVWHANYQGAPRDGSAWRSGGEQGRRVVRGGSWLGDAGFCRPASRLRFEAGYRLDYLGFRVVRVSP